MRTTLVINVILAGLASPAAFAQSPPLSDADFVAKASIGNSFEMEEAKLALDRATDARLKGFAQKMIADHGDAMKTLEAAADKAANKAVPMLDKPHQAMLDNLKTFSGTDFDKIYMADQVAAHAETIALLSDYKQNGKNGDLMSWVKEALPVVKTHQTDINAM